MKKKQKIEPHDSPKWPRWPRVSVPSLHHWRWFDVIVLTYGAGIVFGAPVIIAAKCLSWYWSLPRV